MRHLQKELEFLKMLKQLNRFKKKSTSPRELDLLGVYFLEGPVGTWNRRLILDGRGNYHLGHWTSLGNYYHPMESGTYEIIDNQFIPSTRNITFPLKAMQIVQQSDSGRPQLALGEFSNCPLGDEYFVQAEFPTVMTCIATDHTGYVFTNSLTLGNHYLVLSHDPEKNRFVLINDRGRTRIYPAAIFQRKGLI